MIRFYLVSLLIMLSAFLFSVQAQNPELLEKIQANILLSYGGSDLIEFDNITYIVGVAAVETGNKRISTLTRIGKIKAEQQVVTFVNGADITSKTESYLKEQATTVNDSTVVETIQNFVEFIREDSEGFVNEMQPAGFWYSEDRSVFYYAIYKHVNL